MKILIDRDECLSSGKCVADAPQAFGFDDEELVVALGGVDDLADDLAVKIVRNCPSGALRIADDNA
ncbi:MAG: ferredoxin [Acidimicrobiales bacterium]